MSIHEVVIEVGDVAAAVDFYTKVVGFKLVRTVDEGRAKAAELDAGGQRVTLVASGGPGVRLALPSKDVKADRRRLGRHGVETGDEPVETAGGAWLDFSDPWGNRLGYWQDRSQR